MQRQVWLCASLALAGSLAPPLHAQKAWTWAELRDRFAAANPTLRAAQLSVDEARDQEVTAYLRPNPEYTLTTDGNQIAPHDGVWQPLSGTFFINSFSYLHEREHKRELRLHAAQANTRVAEWQRDDQARTLMFTLRNNFVQALQAKAVLEVAKENLAYYDRTLDVNRLRFKAGDIARIDLDRLELQRVQFESDVLTAETNLRTAKIQLLALLNDRTPVTQFDVTGTFDFQDTLLTLQELHDAALASRPDLQAAVQTIQMAKINHQLAVANGSTDPTFGGWWTHNASTNNPAARETLGLSVNIPLRLFDRNQGEKARTLVEVRRDERLEEAARAQVFSDVDSAYTTLENNLALLRPYKTTYLALASRVRDNVSFSYQHGGSSLLDFLNAQNDYRTVQLNYVNLVGAYLTAAAQLNLAVGREVIQ
ncbi:MAG TPA: TolC family protein [Bryobacteraceae bacterium]|nr:TolC family protein [Bryobacteraceae bacterium]